MINYLIGAVVSLVVNCFCYFWGKTEQKSKQSSEKMFYDILALDRASRIDTDIKRYNVLSNYHEKFSCSQESAKMLQDVAEKIHADLCLEMPEQNNAE